MAEFGDPLSPRETDVFHEMVAGGSNKEIASALSISPNTVKVHVRNILTKMGAASRTEVVMLGVQQGLIDGVELVEEDDETLTPQPPLPEGRGGEDNVSEGATTALSVNGIEASLDDSTDLAHVQESGKLQANDNPINYLIYLLPLLLILVIAAVFAYQRLVQSEPERLVETRLAERGWWLSQPLTAPRAGMATVGDGVNIYWIGGESADGIDGSTATFDSRDKIWRTLAEKPTPVTDAAAAVVGGQVYVVGGRMPDGSATSAVEVYSPAADGWRSAASLPVPLTGAVAISDGKVLYVMGGENLRGVTRSFQVYDPIDDSWRPLPPPKTSRSFAAGAMLDNRLYIVGGRSQTDELDICERFDPQTEQWEDCPPLLHARAGAQAISLFDKLYVLGGSSDTPVTNGELFDTESDNWSVVNIPIDTSWTRLGLANIETRIYLIGGERDGQLQADMYAFEPRPFQIFLPSTQNEP